MSACIWLKQEISVAPTHRRHRWHLTVLRYTWNVRMPASIPCILEIPNVGSYLFCCAVASPYFICATLVPPCAFSHLYFLFHNYGRAFWHTRLLLVGPTFQFMWTELFTIFAIRTPYQQQRYMHLRLCVRVTTWHSSIRLSVCCAFKNVPTVWLSNASSAVKL